MKSYLSKILHFVYPSRCLSCEERLQNPFQKLCASCNDLIEIDNNLENVCFEKLSPSKKLYENYTETGSKSIKKFFVSVLLYRLYSDYSFSTPTISIYENLEKRLFNRKQFGLSEFAKELRKKVQGSYVKLFNYKPSFNDAFSKKIEDVIFVKEDKLHQIKGEVLILSENEITKFLKEKIERQIPGKKIYFLALFET